MSEKVALITGAGSGIGRKTAIALSATHTVIAAGRRQTSVDETASMIPGGRGVGLSVDVTDAASVSALYGAIEARFGRLDLLFNNAGVDVPGIPIDEIRFEDWSRILATNLTGQFLCAQAAFRLMKAQDPQGGRIINNGSIAAHSPRPNSIPYSVSKHGVNGLTKGLMIDGRPFGIAASQIDIGNAAEDPAAQRGMALQANGQRAEEPFMSFDNVAAAVVFMASLPREANVPFLTVMATNMPFVGRG